MIHQLLYSKINILHILILSIFCLSQYACSVQKTQRDGLANISFHLEKVDQIRKNNFKIGDTISTTNFASKNDEGGATYIVSERTISSGPLSFKTKNGLYANLINHDTVDIRQLGAIPNNESAVLANISAIKDAIKVASYVIIPSGTYYLNKAIDLPSNVEIVGKGKAILVGTFAINGNKNITIRGLGFKHWTRVRSYGVWIKPRSAANLKIENCVFYNKVQLFADKPVDKLSDNISVKDCKFKYDYDLDPSGVVAVQLHSSNVSISKCDFDVEGIDGCIKGAAGAGKFIVDSCSFVADLDEEIFDFYTFTGNVWFTNNKITLSRGGVIRTKPGKLPNIVKEPYDVYIENNKIKHTGDDQNLIYIAGSYNLTNHVDDTHIINIKNNTIKCKVVNTPISIRGVEQASISDNVITGQQQKPNAYSIYITSIKDLQIERNNIEHCGIIGYLGGTPGGDKYKRNVSISDWAINSNVFFNYSSTKSPVHIEKIENLILSISNNIFKGFNTNSNIVSVLNGDYKKVNLFDNIIKSNSGNEKKVQKGNITTRGASIQDMRLENVKQKG